MSNKRGQNRHFLNRIHFSSSLSSSKSIKNSWPITPPISPLIYPNSYLTLFNSSSHPLRFSSLMKRSIISGADSFADNFADRKMKKIKADDGDDDSDKIESVLLDENLLYEVLKHADARTLGSAACVNKQWNKTAKDERLWELICTKQWANIGCGKQQLRSVVLALGGFRRLHALYLWPLAKPAVVTAPQATTATTSAWPCLPPPVKSGPAVAPAAKTRWGKDEVHLSLSLLSIRYYEKMNFSGRGK